MLITPFLETESIEVINRRQFAIEQRDQLAACLLTDREQVEALACDAPDPITRRLAAHFLAQVIISEAV